MIFSFLSDVLSSGIWLDAVSLSDSSLSDVVPGFIDLQLDAPSEVQVWLVTVARVGSVEVWCSRYSGKTFAYRIVYLSAS